VARHRRGLIDGLMVNGSAAVARFGGWIGSQFQSGQVGTYAWVLVVGVSPCSAPSLCADHERLPELHRYGTLDSPGAADHPVVGRSAIWASARAAEDEATTTVVSGRAKRRGRSRC
jgi:hypothetical protein